MAAGIRQADVEARAFSKPSSVRPTIPLDESLADWSSSCSAHPVDPPLWDTFGVRPAAYVRSMDTTKPNKTVAGESLAVLERAEKFVRPEVTGKMVRFHIDVPPALREPFTRAVMRVEAELLREYADACSADPSEPLPSREGLHALAVATLLQRVVYGTDTPPSFASSPHPRSRPC